MNQSLVLVAITAALFCEAAGRSSLAQSTQHLISTDAAPKGLSASDWNSIRAAYDAHRHQVTQARGGYRARNPEQQWRTEFDGRGFTTRPAVGDWQWGLELKSYGFAGQKCVIDDQADATAEGERVTYARDAALQEWFVNGQRGLEHGFTIARQPVALNEQRTDLEFDLALRGCLLPKTDANGKTVSFQDAEGSSVVTYSELKVSDADGCNLPARFAVEQNIVRLLVDEGGARYPITVDPVAQQAYVQASNAGFNDQFGHSVAVSGDIAVVGANAERSDATGVNGDQNNDNAPQSGAAYVFVRNGATWTQEAYLKASNTETGDVFGWSVAISGDTIVVGAASEDSDANGVNGNQSDNNAPTSGAAYVFVRNGTTWSQQAYLKASNSDEVDQFGSSVAIDGDTVVVGAIGESSNATGVNGGQTDNSAHFAGAAYVFVRNGTTWSQQAYLKASNTDAEDSLGNSVAISGDTVVVGAPFESSNAKGINGNQSDNSASQAGASYVFVRNGTTWSQQAYVKASNTDAGDFFGFSVALSGDTAVVGAYQEASNATGINGGQNDNSRPLSGAAYVFVRTGATWSQQAYIKASNTGGFFGYSVAASGDTAVVGAILESSSATGINGDQNDGSAPVAGAAYVFVRNGATWSQQAYVKASNTHAQDRFGYSVAIDGDTSVIGAYLESAQLTGAAYMFTGLGPTPVIPLLNISTRLNVGTGENVLIGGFIVTGTDPKKVILRAIGPSLTAHGSRGRPG